jgi:hypothetical protein
MWLDEDPDASPGERDRNDRDGRGDSVKVTSRGKTRPVAPYETGWITVRDPLLESPLIKQIDRDSIPHVPVSGRAQAPSA